MKCPLYKEHLYIHFIDKLPKEEVVPVCAGTKEQERCKCNGDRCKCDFYSGIRENAKREQLVSDILIAYETLGDLVKKLIEEGEKK